MVPTLGGVHKIQILIGDLLKEILQKIFGEEMGGGQGDPDPLIGSGVLVGAFRINSLEF